MSEWKSEWASTRVHDDTYACCDSFGRKGNRFAKIEYYNTAYIYSHTERMVDDERSIRKGSTRNFPLKIHKLSWHTYNENNNTAHAAALSHVLSPSVNENTQQIFHCCTSTMYSLKTWFCTRTKKLRYANNGMLYTSECVCVSFIQSIWLENYLVCLLRCVEKGVAGCMWRVSVYALRCMMLI